MKKFVDSEAEFIFVAPSKVEMAEKLNAIPFDVPGAELGHKGGLAIAEGFRLISSNDYENMEKRKRFPVYDAFYAFCRLKVESMEGESQQ